MEASMKPGIRSTVVALAVGVLVLGSAQRVQAIGPSVLMFYGGKLQTPVLVTGAEANLFGDLLTPSKVAPADIAGRTYLKVAVFWGTQANPTGLGVKLSDLKPEMAWQHGKYYPATGSKPAVLIVTTVHKKTAQRAPDFTQDESFVWGGALSPAAAAAVVTATTGAKPAR
jgi:hypothetical protein